MPDTFAVTVNGRAVQVQPGTTAAAAILIAGADFCRVSVRGEARAPVCGMGICFECRARVDGMAHARTCQLPCRAGMAIVTDAG